MQYLVLIYEDESRFANGYPEAEFAEYGAFGKKHASAIKAGQRAAAHWQLPRRFVYATPRCSPPMVLSRKRKSSLAAIT